jgi:hypothetical protein
LAGSPRPRRGGLQSPNRDKAWQKTSNIECFKCGGHGDKKAECPNRRVIIAFAGAYDSQSEDEDAHDDTNSHD